LIFLLAFLNNTLPGQSKYFLTRNELTAIDSLIVVKVQDSGFTTYCDSSFYSRYLVFWSNIMDKKQKTLIDSVGCSPYTSDVFIYKSKLYQDYLIFWVTENEYSSDILVYMLNNHLLTKIGPLKIKLDCETCDDDIYPFDRKKIIGYKDKIIVEPTDDFLYEVEKGKWQKFKAKEATFIIDKKNKILRLRQEI